MIPGKRKFIVQAFQQATKKSMELPFLDYNQDCPNIVRMRSNILPTEKTTGRYFLFEHDRHPLLNSVYVYV